LKCSCLRFSQKTIFSVTSAQGSLEPYNPFSDIVPSSWLKNPVTASE
jgi:hypothetical protein